MSYTYDGDGKRVQKSNGKLYWYGMGSDPLDESDAAGNITDEYIFFNGKRIARRTSGSSSSSIPVQNGSFGSSNPLNLSCYCGPYNNSGVPGWTSSGVGPFGSWQPNANSYNSPLPGVVAMVEVGTLSQTLTGTALQPNATYTLSVDVGHRLEGYVTTYSISLQAGPNVVATISGSNGTIPAGTFQTQTLTYAAGSAPPAGDLTIVLNSTGSQSNFKNVVLTMSASTSIRYYFSDHRGTARVVTDVTGTVRDDSDFYPFGGERVVLSSSGNNYKFTGKERDSESSLDNFGARYDSSSMGRFMSPDPVNISGLLYQSDPQSWNGYAYARNNPLLYGDPDGLTYQICDNSDHCQDIADEDFNKYFRDAKTVKLNDNQISIDGNKEGTFTRKSFDDLGVLGNALFNEMSARRQASNQMIGAFAAGSVVIGATGGAACYYLCPAATVTTLGTTAGAVGTAAAPLVTDTRLQNFVNMLFQASDKLPGGTAGAVRHELETGDLLSPAGHSQKAQEIINGLQRLVNSGTLSPSDTATARGLIQNLKSALSTKQ